MKPSLARRPFVLPAVLAAIASCGPHKDATRPPANPQLQPALAIDEKEDDGLRFRLSEGVPEAGAREKLARPAATKLAPAEVEKILARLPALVGQAADKVEFALRERSLPPPRTGAKVNVAFPQTGPPPGVAPTAGPLQVLRHQPDGDVPIAARMSVTFDQPMIAVTSHDDAVKTLPLEITPEPKGTWRWVGTKTLVFEAEAGKADRFPMATEYRVEVPAGTKSAVGGVLADVQSFTFRTPPPTVVSMYPQGGPQRLDPVIWIEFDQKIDPAAVLERLEIHAGSRTLRARAATPTEIETDATIRSFAKGADTDGRHDRWLAARLAGGDGVNGALLPPDTDIKVVIPTGTPSAEGPRKTEADQEFSFRTYGPMKVVEARCGWNDECPPLSPWYVRFSNPIEAKKFDNKSMVRVSPEVKGLKVAVYGDGMEIYGLTKGRTTYELTLTAAVPDVFGQTLGDDYQHTFRVGSAPEVLSGAGEGFLTLDPVGPPRYSVYTINYKKVKVHAYKVDASDWPKFLDYMKAVNYDDKDVTPPGKLVIDDMVSISGEADEITETRVDLAKVLPNGLGQAILIVEPPTQPKNRWERRYLRAWVQGTKIGLSATVDATDLYGLATSLADGAPLSGVELSVYPGTAPGSAHTASGSDGTAVFALPASVTPDNHPSLLIARQGDDVAILPENTSWWGGGTGWIRRDYGTGLGWYTFDDRNLYKPGEEVKVKGWIRIVGQNKGGDVMPLGGAVTKLTWKAMDSYGNEVAKGEDTVNAIGGFDYAFKLPKTMNLGGGSVQMQVADGTYSGNTSWLYFQVEEFRRPEFEVSAQASEGPHIIGGHAIASVKATYYAGGALPDAETSWQVTASPGWYSPPNWDEFTFGSWRPWWVDYYDYQGGPGTGYQSFTARTDGGGEHHLRLDFDGVKPARPYTVTAQASVTDVNRQQWSASASMLVHPSSVYVGLKSDRLFVQAGETFKIDSIVTDIDGKAVAGRPVARTFVLLDWEQENGEWVQKEKSPESCDKASEAAAVTCEFTPKEGGTYRLSAVVVDAEGRRNKSELTLWVAGGKTKPERGVVQEQVTLVPNKKEYRGGETAQVLVSAPFWPAEGTMTIRRSGIVKSERFTLRESSTTLRIPIEEGYTPNFFVQVDLVGAAPRLGDDGTPNAKLPKRPAYASGTVNLKVPPFARTLGLTVTPRDPETEPGTDTEVNVLLEDSEGQPVSGAEVAVVVVDEAVLALTGYDLPDPIAIFYGGRPTGASDYYMRSSVILANPLDVLGKGGGAPGGADTGAMGGAKDKVMRAEAKPMEAPSPAAAPPAKAVVEKEESKNGGEANTPIQVRTNFDALATFAAELPTDAAGRTRVAVKLPDNLTRYRVMAIAASTTGKQFGKGESTITARLPLMVRPSAPRFLNFGDRFELPVVLQNQTGKPLTVDVAARATNATLTDAAGLRVTVPAKDRVEVRFPVAAEMAGTARFQFGAVSGKWADAAEISLPVWTPATTEAFATYGVIDDGAIVQPIAAPRDAVKQFGGLEITTSSTQLQALTDAVLYIVSYPFECSEQISSRVITIAALRDVLSAFQAEGLPPPDALIKSMDHDVERLRTLQNDNGGWGFWRRGEEDWPYLTIHVTHALARAKDKGFTVPANMLERASAYLKDIESHIPGYYPPEVRRALVAYSLYVRKRLGDVDVAKAKRVLAEVSLDKHGLETVGWIYGVLAGDAGSKSELAAIRKHLGNRAIEEAGTAHFITSYSDGANLLLASDRRADGILLEAMIMDDPKNDLIPKVVEGLLAHRTAGHWENTQENAFVLLALDLYFHTFEKITPDFVSRAWLGDAYAGDHKFKGRTTERAYTEVPMAYLMKKPATQDLILQKDGAGRMYYRIGMNYAPASLKLEPSEHGFTVERQYEAVDDPRDVRKDEAGVWHIKAGAKVRVRVSMVAPTRRYHVALVDPLPAGLEAMNPALQGTASIPADPNDKSRGGGWWWWGPWYEHQNLRDERAEAFTSMLWEGVYDYTYIARATTPGTFVVPPPKAEEMYHPETFGRGGTDRVIVEE